VKDLREEKEIQENFPFARQKYFSEFNAILAYYQAVSCLENARGTSALDIPCGDGTVTELFARQFQRVVGVDASSVHLTEARKRLPEVEFHESLIEELDLPEKFDSIFMLNILEHVLDPVTTLRKTASFLKDDGILIAHVPNAYAINRRIAVIMGTLEGCEELSPFDIQIAGHRRSYRFESLCKDTEDAGLRVVKTGGIFYKMLSTAQIDWFLKNGLWEEGGFGWGRMGGEKRDWKVEFCRACYEIGKERPEDCNIIYVCAMKGSGKKR
jgi:2-polyprenyl-3-methyl-5-hydroxy-6-metoxy-1,4-benzoquinol methylase